LAFPEELFFWFFSGAALAGSMLRCDTLDLGLSIETAGPCAAEKQKNEWVGDDSVYKQATPTGFPDPGPD
jgi:hypothetical protein